MKEGPCRWSCRGVLEYGLHKGIIKLFFVKTSYDEKNRVAKALTFLIFTGKGCQPFHQPIVWQKLSQAQ